MDTPEWKEGLKIGAPDGGSENSRSTRKIAIGLVVQRLEERSEVVRRLIRMNDLYESAGSPLAQRLDREANRSHRIATLRGAVICDHERLAAPERDRARGLVQARQGKSDASRL